MNAVKDTFKRYVNITFLTHKSIKNINKKMENTPMVTMNDVLK